MGSAANPVTGLPGATNTNQSSSSSAGNSSTQLGANSFISLLTAELQAQDPTSPMNPEDMMNQMVSMNSLQTLLNIQQILSTATGVAAGPTSSGSSGTQSSNAQPAAQEMAARAVKTPNASYHDAIFQSNQIAASGPSNQ